MPATITVSATTALQMLEGMRRLKSLALFAGGEAVYRFFRNYHSKMDWRGPRWIPGPNSGQFAQNVVYGWQPPEVGTDGVIVRNTFGLLAWKISGGTITPKYAQALTIPLTTKAKVYTARTFPGILFRTGNALSTQYGRRLGGAIIPQYALAKSVTQKPWPGAMPPQEDIEAEFTKGVELVLPK